METNAEFTGRLTCSLGVTNHRAAAAWYARILGCQLMFESAEMGMSFMSTPVKDVFLDLSQIETVQPGGGAVPVWSVASVDSARARLEREGVRFDGPTRTYEGMVKLATFFDPDGNALMIYESLSSGGEQ